MVAASEEAARAIASEVLPVGQVLDQRGVVRRRWEIGLFRRDARR